MKEKLKQIIAGLLMENMELKLILTNDDELTEEEVNMILDQLAINREMIEKLQAGLK